MAMALSTSRANTPFRRLFSAAAASGPVLLGHFHHPVASAGQATCKMIKSGSGGKKEEEEDDEQIRKPTTKLRFGSGGKKEEEEEEEEGRIRKSTTGLRSGSNKEPFHLSLQKLYLARQRKKLLAQPPPPRPRSGIVLDPWPTKDLRFVPTRASPLLDRPNPLDFVPAGSQRFAMVDSHDGLLLLLDDNQVKLVLCDPILPRYACLPDLPEEAAQSGNVTVVGAALLSRSGDLACDVVLVAVSTATGQPRAWVASITDDDDCMHGWRALPPQSDKEVRIRLPITEVDPICVHAAGLLVWHLGHVALTLDATTAEFSLIHMPLPGPAMHCRVGEQEHHGSARLISARTFGGTVEVFALEPAKVPDDINGQWTLLRSIALQEQVLDTLRGPNQSAPLLANFWPVSFWLSNVGAPCTNKVFIRTHTDKHYSYDLDTGEFKALVTEDGLHFGQPLFPYFTPSANW